MIRVYKRVALLVNRHTLRGGKNGRVLNEQLNKTITPSQVASEDHTKHWRGFTPCMEEAFTLPFTSLYKKQDWNMEACSSIWVSICTLKADYKCYLEILNYFTSTKIKGGADFVECSCTLWKCLALKDRLCICSNIQVQYVVAMSGHDYIW